MHFEYIAEAVSHGIMAVSADTGVPVTFGVLTTLTAEQAVARAADGPDNKGREAALAAVEMATIVQAIGGLGQA
jgi:6,7-dimethyl-8-ribityllumazine synthase